MRSRARQSGFVLVLVLVVVVICATVLASTARRCGQSALQANAALRDVQFRWGAASCWSAVRAQADILLNEGRDPQTQNLCEAHHVVTLGGVKFHLIVSDETAKANINLLAKNRDDASLVAMLQRLQVGSGGPLTAVLRPLQATGADRAAPADRYAGFEQVFALRGPGDLVWQADGTSAIACRRMTFWSGGPVNVRRADMVVLRELLTGILSESHLAALDGMRRNELDFTLTKAIPRLQLTQKQIEDLSPLITDKMDCVSLWVIAEGQTRNWYRLYVQQQGQDSNGGRHWTIAW